MTRLFHLFRNMKGQKAANGMSFSIAVFAIGFLYLESAPTPAGADVARKATNKRSFVIVQTKAEDVSQPAQQAQPAAGDAVVADLTPEQISEKHLLTKVQLIEKGLEFLTKTPDYTATFVKQELVNGQLLDEQEMELKIRHAPFSIYLKWTTGEAGREVLYVDGLNDGRMMAHGGGWKARLPAVNLELTSSLALAESRYPVNKAGLHELAKLMLRVHQEDLQYKRVAKCEKLADQEFDGRACHAFLVEYKDAKLSEHYRKSISLIDKEWSIPVYTRNFGWLSDSEVPADPEQHDAASLVEFYSYANVQFRPKLIAADFEHSNEDYRFKRQ